MDRLEHGSLPLCTRSVGGKCFAHKVPLYPPARSRHATCAEASSPEMNARTHSVQRFFTHAMQTGPAIGSVLVVQAPSAQGTHPSKQRMHRGPVSLERKIAQHFVTEHGTYKETGKGCVSDVATQLGPATVVVGARSEEDTGSDTDTTDDARIAPAVGESTADPEEDAAPWTETIEDSEDWPVFPYGQGVSSGPVHS